VGATHNVHKVHRVLPRVGDQQQGARAAAVAGRNASLPPPVLNLNCMGGGDSAPPKVHTRVSPGPRAPPPSVSASDPADAPPLAVSGRSHTDKMLLSVPEVKGGARRQTVPTPVPRHEGRQWHKVLQRKTGRASGLSGGIPVVARGARGRLSIFQQE
jgi:hypothetical protein